MGNMDLPISHQWNKALLDCIFQKRRTILSKLDTNDKSMIVKLVRVSAAHVSNGKLTTLMLNKKGLG